MNKTDTNSARSDVKRPWVASLGGVCLLLALGACSSQSRDIYDRHLPENVARTQEAWSALRQPQAQQDYLVEDKTPVISTRSVPLARDAALPSHIKRVVFRFPGRHTLPTLTERISREIGIPIILAPDALRPASSYAPGSGAVGGAAGAAGAAGVAGVAGAAGMLGATPFGQPGNAAGSSTQAFASGAELGALVVNPLDYQRTFELSYAGTLDGLLDKLAAMASLNWKYEDQRLVFYRAQTRSFTIKTFPGALSLGSSTGGAAASGGGSDAGGASMGGGASGGAGAGGSSGGQADFWTGLEANLKAILSSAGKMNLDKNAGILVVTDGNEVMAMVEQYINQMNQLMMRQIKLEVEVVTIDLNESHASGIDWTVVSQLSSGSLTYTTPPSPSTAGTPFSIEFTGTNGRSAMLRALQAFGQVTSAYSGVVVTANRTPAPISVSNTLAYVRQTTPAVVASAAAGAVAATSGLTPGQITTGTNMVLLPMILESNLVLMQCSVSISSLKELTRFDSGSGASQQSVQLPNVDTFTMVQRMAIPSGQTMVVMGYDQARTGSTTNGPFGQVVTGRSGNGNKQSIVIMITPRISDI